MIEMLIVMSVLAIMMSVIGNVTGTTNDAVELQSRDAEVATLARRNLQRISAFARPAKLSTFKVTWSGGRACSSTPRPACCR